MKCDKCGKTKPDVLLRGFATAILKRFGFVRKNGMVETTYDPMLCTLCCSKMPERAWMASSEYLSAHPELAVE